MRTYQESLVLIKIIYSHWYNIITYLVIKNYILQWYKYMYVSTNFIISCLETTNIQIKWINTHVVNNTRLIITFNN